MLLSWLAAERRDAAAAEAGKAIEQAVAAALARGPRTPDLGGTASTSQFTEGILKNLTV